MPPKFPHYRAEDLMEFDALQARGVVIVRKAALEEPVSLEVVKGLAEQRYTLGLAYPANRVDKSVAADGYRDFVSPEVLEQTAWKWMKGQRDISMFHAGDTTKGHAEVVESYIYRGPDWEPTPGVLIKAGDWMLGTLWDTVGWNLVKSGKVRGWSPEGGARRTVADANRLATLRP